MKDVGVEYISKVAWRYGRYGRGLVAERRDENDGFEREVIRSCSWDGDVG